MEVSIYQAARNQWLSMLRTRRRKCHRSTGFRINTLQEIYQYVSFSNSQSWNKKRKCLPSKFCFATYLRNTSFYVWYIRYGANVTCVLFHGEEKPLSIKLSQGTLDLQLHDRFMTVWAASLWPHYSQVYNIHHLIFCLLHRNTNKQSPTTKLSLAYYQ